jgi:hypothetical protein
MSTVRTTDGVSNVFAKIILDVAPSSIAFNTFVANDMVYENAKDMIKELEISFRTRNNTLVDFQGLPVSLTFEFLHER